VPELNNFVTILQREEEQRMKDIMRKYRNFRKQIMKRMRHLDKRQAGAIGVST
jgi:hypothetical protein